MISDLPDPAPEECDCHEWFDLDEIGQWPHSLAGGRASQPKSVRDIVATEPIWDRSEPPREELTTRIIAAGHRIGHDYALSALLPDRRLFLLVRGALQYGTCAQTLQFCAVSSPG